MACGVLMYLLLLPLLLLMKMGAFSNPTITTADAAAAAFATTIQKMVG